MEAGDEGFQPCSSSYFSFYMEYMSDFNSIGISKNDKYDPNFFIIETD